MAKSQPRDQPYTGYLGSLPKKTSFRTVIARYEPQPEPHLIHPMKLIYTDQKQRAQIIAQLPGKAIRNIRSVWNLQAEGIDFETD